MRTPEDGPGDDALLVGTAEGDRKAFQCLMERHSKPMLVLAQRVLGNAHDADEVVQETFLKVWSMASRWEPEGRAKFSTWLYRVVLNACLDRLRRMPMAPLDEVGELADRTPSSMDRALAQQRHHILIQAMAQLPPRQQTALSLHYFGEVSAPRAAEILNLSLSACEALLARGKKTLRKILAGMGINGLGDVL
ncbi:RNA polymerase sigma factor [Telmatospirillum siberiense]|uniref:RNA polymerase subunit sigma n=1 Tax=Telmatospirillum siberiense TaxID=382514 RepID=A0A2N3PVE2_9PROT|nr:RNA polymerase sigma factor [Telmatospirillum siberiense]PKU24372.1 RNA polymerase subunit sigma [Telmatospirillum siberiense]